MLLLSRIAYYTHTKIHGFILINIKTMYMCVSEHICFSMDLVFIFSKSLRKKGLFRKVE